MAHACSAPINLYMYLKDIESHSTYFPPVEGTAVFNYTRHTYNILSTCRIDYMLYSFQLWHLLQLWYPLVFGSFGLSTKEPYTIMLCPSCVIILHHCWHWCWHHLYTPTLATGLDMEASYLVHFCTYVHHICKSNI